AFHELATPNSKASPSPRTAFGRDGHGPRTTRRGRAPRTGVDLRRRSHPMGQRRLRGPRQHHGRSIRRWPAAGGRASGSPHPCREPILKRTLGVPLFQEQLLRIAMVAANFTGGEAEELRRAMGFKRSMERMQDIEGRLRAGMTKNEIDQKAQDQIVKSITSFALYGFPESHAASFALIAYASAYIKE